MMMSTLWSSDGAKSVPTIDLPRAKILILGESAVGKSAFVQAILGEPSTSSQQQWTVGASVDVLLHTHQSGTLRERQFFVEVYDIGGSKSHTIARPVFYTGAHGIVLVHDLTNKKSADALANWLKEALKTLRASNDQRELNATQNSIFNNTPRQPTLLPTSWSDTALMESEEHYDPKTDPPVLLVGTKLDLAAHLINKPPQGNQTCRAKSECKCEEMWLDCSREFAPASSNSVVWSHFLDQVITYSQKDDALSPNMGRSRYSAAPDRRRLQHRQTLSPYSNM